MRALKKKDLIQSTLVVFISDNGAPGPSHKKASSSASSLRPQPSVQYKQRRRLTNGDATDSAFVAASATRATGTLSSCSSRAPHRCNSVTFNESLDHCWGKEKLTKKINCLPLTQYPFLPLSPGKENDHGKRPYPSNYPLHGYKGSLWVNQGLVAFFVFVFFILRIIFI